MRKTKYCVAQFTFYDRTGIQVFLERQAEKGWLLEKIGVFFWKFRRIEPKTVHYAVTYFPKASVFDPEPSESQARLLEFCAHAGWVLAGTTAQMQVFYHEGEDPVPIETDPLIELENIHKAAKKSYLPSYFLLLAVALLNGGMFLWRLHHSVIETLSSNLNLFSALCWLLLFLGCSMEILGYYLWYRKARKAAQEDGCFIKTWGFRSVWIVISWILFSGLALTVSTLGGKLAVALLCCLVLISGLMLLVVGIREGLKRLQFSAGDNRIITIVSTVVLSFLVAGVGALAVFQAVDSIWPTEYANTYEYKGHTFIVYDDVLPLNIQDLTDQAEGAYSYRFTGSASLLLEKYTANQDPQMSNLELPTLRYVILDVKAPWIYDACLKELLEQHVGWEYTDVYGNVYRDEFREVDAAPWGVDAAYQGFNGEYGEREYVLCFGNRIINIEFSWNPTEEQMAIVAQKLGR